MNGWVNRLLLVMLALSIAAMLVVGIWLVWPYDVIQQEFDPLPLQSTTLHVGETIVYHARYTKTMDVVGIASVQLVDSMLIFYPDVTFAGKPGHYDIWGRTFTVPVNAFPGPDYYLQFTVTYQVNPVRTIVERYRTEKFTVVSGDK